MTWRRSLVVFAIVCVLLYVPAILGYAWSLTGLTGLDDWNILGVLVFLFLPFLGGIVAMLALPWSLFAKERDAFIVAVLALAFALMAVPAYWVAAELRKAGFHAMSKRGQPLVDAVAKYERDKGEPPASITALIPSYLPSLPWGFSRVQILRGPHARQYICKGNNWVLEMDSSIGILNWDKFFYLPAQNYDQCGASVERFGPWAYHHE